MTSTDERPAPPADPTAGMDDPGTLLDGRVIDLTVSDDAPDPFVDPCPAWCDFKGSHRIAMGESQRNHYGRQIVIPLRLERAEFFLEGKTFTLGHARLYWHRHAGERDARLLVMKGDTDGGFELTRDEARQFRDALDALLSEADEG